MKINKILFCAFVFLIGILGILNPHNGKVCATHAEKYLGVKTKIPQQGNDQYDANNYYHQQQQKPLQAQHNYAAYNQEEIINTSDNQRLSLLRGKTDEEEEAKREYYQPPNVDYNKFHKKDEYFTACPEKFTGQLAYAPDCHSFLNCYNGQGRVQPCAPGTLFNAHILTCDRADNVQCHNNNIKKNPSARLLSAVSADLNVLCPKDFSGLRPYAEDCTKFINCAHGRAFLQDCGPGTAYNAEHMVCDFPYKVNCGNRYSKLSNTASNANVDNNKIAKSLSHSVNTLAYVEEDTQDLLCPKDISGMFPHPFDNTRFINCHNGQTGIQNCEYNKVYSISQRRCVEKNHNFGPYDHVTYNIAEVDYSKPLSLVKCPPGTEGIHMYPFSENKKCHCNSNGDMQITQCPNGYNFDMSSQSCQQTYSYSQNLAAATPRNAYSAASLECPSDSSKLFYPYPFDGSKYISCRNNQYSVENCQSGYLFSLLNRQCRSARTLRFNDYVQVLVNGEQNMPNIDMDTIIRNGKIMCPLNAHGEYLHPFDCTKYLRCREGQISVDSCQAGSVFSITQRSCVTRDLVEANDRVDYWSNTQHEFYDNGGQQKFNKDHEQGQPICPPGKTFNSISQRCLGDSAPIPAAPSNDRVDYWSNTQHQVYDNPVLGQKHSNKEREQGTRYIKECPPGKTFNVISQQCMGDSTPIPSTPGNDRVDYWSNTQHEVYDNPVLGQKQSNNDHKQGPPICPPGKTFNLISQLCQDPTPIPATPWQRQPKEITDHVASAPTNQHNVLYMEGSLQPQYTYHRERTDVYSTPLASIKPPVATNINTTSVYFAQPVGSQENSEEVFNINPTTSRTSYPYPYPFPNSYVHTQKNESPYPYAEARRGDQEHPLDNAYSPTLPDSGQRPLLEEDFGQQKETNIYDDLQKPLNFSSDPYDTQQPIYTKYESGSNQYSQYQTTTAKNIYLQNQLTPIDSVIPISQIHYATNTIQYSPTYSEVKHSRNTSWSTKPVHHHDHYSNRSPKTTEIHADDDTELNNPVISEALRILLKPYVAQNFSGELNANIMSLVSQPALTTTAHPRLHGALGTVNEDAEFVVAGEQNHLTDDILPRKGNYPLFNSNVKHIEEKRSISNEEESKMVCPPGGWLCENQSSCIIYEAVCNGVNDCDDKSDEKYCQYPKQYRLVGNSPKEGRLEVLHAGVWGTVCNSRSFGKKEIQVACKQLGFDEGKKIINHNPSSGPIWLHRIFCKGNESTLDACAHEFGNVTCNHKKELALSCNKYEDIPAIDIPFNGTCGTLAEHLRNEFSTIAEPGRHPWLVTIRNIDTPETHRCGGALISQKHILTAANCVHGLQFVSYFVRLGDHDSSKSEQFEVDAKISQVHIHEDFDTNRVNYDIALIQLENAINFTEFIKPICLPTSETMKLTKHHSCTTAGWGSIKGDTEPINENLRTARVRKISGNSCGAEQHSNLLCAHLTDECDGDYGGPLTCYNEDVEILYAIIPSDHQCSPTNKTSFYLGVENFIEWISSKMRSV